MAIQYRALKAPQDFAAVEKFLNDQGADNWELVAITPTTGVAIFKKTGSPSETVPPEGAAS